MYNLNNLKLLWEQQIKNEYIKYQKFIEFYVFGLKSIYDKYIENVEIPLYSECIFNNLIITL